MDLLKRRNQYVVVVLFSLFVANCRSQSALQDGSGLSAADPGGNLRIKNTLTGTINGEIDPDAAVVTKEEIAQMHAIGIDNNHSFSIQDLETSFFGISDSALSKIHENLKTKTNPWSIEQLNRAFSHLDEETINKISKRAQDLNAAFTLENLKSIVTYSTKDLRKLHVIEVSANDINGVYGPAAYVLFQETSEGFFLVHDISIKPEFLDVPEIYKAIDGEIKATRSAVGRGRAELPAFLLAKKNQHHYVLENAKLVGFQEKQIRHYTTNPRTDDNVKITYDNQQVYVKGDISDQRILDKVADSVSREQNRVGLDPEKIESRLDPIALATLLDAKVEEATRKMRREKKPSTPPEFDSVGKESLELMVTILNRSKPRSPIFLGDAGVGKSYLMEKFISLFLRDDFDRVQDPEVKELAPFVRKFLQGRTVLYFNESTLTAGAQYKGTEEERLEATRTLAVRVDTLSKDEKTGGVVIVCDEVHLMKDFLAQVKPELSEGRIVAISATTSPEYAASIEKDQALIRRFAAIFLYKAERDRVTNIIENVWLANVNTRESKNELAEYIYEISETFKPGGTVAFKEDFSNHAVSTAQTRNAGLLTKAVIERAAIDWFHLPKTFVFPDQVDSVIAKTPDLTKQIAPNASAEEVAKIEEALKRIISRSADLYSDRPTVFIVNGPKGSGRTYLAETLAKELGRNHYSLDLREFSSPEAFRNKIEEIATDSAKADIGGSHVVFSLENFDAVGEFFQGEVLRVLRKGVFETTHDGVKRTVLTPKIVVALQVSDKQLIDEISKQSPWAVIELQPRTEKQNEAIIYDRVLARLIQLRKSGDKRIVGKPEEMALELVEAVQKRFSRDERFKNPTAEFLDYVVAEEVPLLIPSLCQTMMNRSAKGE